MDQEDLEEGEITDSDDETTEMKATGSSSTAEYNVLPRPTNPAMSYRVPQESSGLPPAQTFRDSPATAANDSDADSDDSDNVPVGGKKAKLQPEVAAKTTAVKKRNLWTDVMLEQQISSKIRSGGMVEDDDIDTVERGVESYRPSGESRTVAIDEFESGKPEAEQGDLWNVNEDGETLDTAKKRTGKKKKKKKHKVHERIDWEYGDDGFDDYDDYLPDEVCAQDDERVIARYIARNLNEPKVVLMERVTRFAGREKALELFNATMDIEAAGGMMTIKGDTRRTPGGVYLQLLKKDKAISKDTIKDIFAVERENQKFTKKVFIQEKKIRKRKYYNKNTEDQDTEMTSATPGSATAEPVEEFEQMEEPDIEIGVAS